MMISIKRDVVTGSSGFIGSRLVELLDGATEIDIKTGIDVRSVWSLNKIKTCYHLAAISSVHACDMDVVTTCGTNVGGTMNMLEMCNHSGYDSFVFASSAAVYGDRELPASETSDTSPLSRYGRSKLIGEGVVNSYPKTAILRLFNVYGPKGNGVINKFVHSAWYDGRVTVYGDGQQSRDFIYVDDVCEAFKAASGKEGTYNVCTGWSASINEIIEIIESVLDKKVSVTKEGKAKGDIDYSCGTNSKAVRDLKWEPKVKLEEGIRKIASRYQS